MFNKAIAAYGRTQKLAPSQREIEAMAFVKAARLLDEARKKVDDREAYAAAVRFNQRLWTLLQAALIEKANPLPNSIKANIMSLSIFVDKQTIKALFEPKAEHLDSLYQIDKNMAGGLLATAADGMPSEEKRRDGAPVDTPLFRRGSANRRPARAIGPPRPPSRLS